MNLQGDAFLDAGEAGCGELLMLIFERMKMLKPGETLQVSAYDEVAEIDIRAWCRMTGNPLLARNLDRDPKQYLIQKRA